MAVNGEALNNSSRFEHQLEPILELLRRQKLVENLAQRQAQSRAELLETLVHRQHEVELRRKLKILNAADAAYLLDMLTLDQRWLVWSMLEEHVAAEAMLEMSEAVLTSIVEETDSNRLLKLLIHLDADELSEIAEFLPADVLASAKAQLEAAEQQWLEASLSYPEDSVGSLMSRDSFLVSPNQSLDEVIAAFRAMEEVPEQMDKLFVVQKPRHLVGVLPLTALLRHPGDERVNKVMQPNPVTFSADEDAEDAAHAFERYDLISAPVVDENRRVIGRLTVETMMDYLREHHEGAALAKEGLSARTDLFGPVMSGARARWLWLCINLATAFLATRFIALFEQTIISLVALATLMPIVASVGGNTGNQTIALFVRGLAMDHINRDNLRFLVMKELLISVINGALWGCLLGGVAFLLYGNPGISVVMAVATLLNLIIAAAAGIFTPLALAKSGRDPAMGASVVLTFVTDSMGFFIFLGLATWWLI
ncbi:magnesium transporter [Gynuella sunshinyii]|uniref:Mg/Co/Ni transporter MgtE (Contains CBS domain) n=1 Tax=Gynuella sunshinyii YC6258 TaxID=1445510 RepID=A0A0C5VFX8_9GAMM|nr:magnesium transporter [Gynuella sunshinyii]AJQ92273.1 mg/Co/Ni transporter MgtE (contains CBS domain) [Gynuella sunshinyii YC6258]